MSALENEYEVLKNKLDSVGYHQPLSFGSMDLVNNLLNDILHYKDGYSSFKDIADELLQEFNLLKLGHKPLIQEFKHLHLENSLPAVQGQGDFQDIRKELKTHISKFQKAYSELETANQQHLLRIGELEDGISELNNKLMEYEKVTDHVKGKKIIKELKLPLNEDDRSMHFLKIDEEDKQKKKVMLKATQTKLKTSISDKEAILKSEKIEKSCQTVSELHCDYKCMGNIDEQCKQKQENYLSQYLVENEEDIVSFHCNYEKIKAERDYYCKEYNLIQEKICHLILEDKIQQKDNYIIKMEKNTVSLRKIVKILSELKLRAEAEVYGLRKKNEVSENEIKNLNKQLRQSSNNIDRLIKKNQHLGLTVTKMNKHIRLLHQNLGLKKQRIMDLKREIHNYISEVRKVEEAIESKEQDFQRILETYSVISEEEVFTLGGKYHDILETDRNSDNEYFEKTKSSVNHLSST